MSKHVTFMHTLVLTISYSWLSLAIKFVHVLLYTNVHMCMLSYARPFSGYCTSSVGYAYGHPGTISISGLYPKTQSCYGHLCCLGDMSWSIPLSRGISHWTFIGLCKTWTFAGHLVHSVCVFSGNVIHCH